MRENRTHGSEGGEGNLPDPYRGGVPTWDKSCSRHRLILTPCRWLPPSEGKKPSAAKFLISVAQREIDRVRTRELNGLTRGVGRGSWTLDDPAVLNPRKRIDLCGFRPCWRVKIN